MAKALITGGHLKGHPNFAYVLDDGMKRPLMLEPVNRTDVIFHLAAAVGVPLIVERFGRSCKHRKFLLESSSEIYGKLDKAKFSEDDDVTLGPTSRARWCYAASKEDVPRRFPGLSRIRDLIGYEPMLSLPEMLDRIIAYERERGAREGKSAR